MIGLSDDDDLIV